ncbi:EAL domain-containing protein [Hoeflea sp. YIM 152468]|uniref:EAL domain-containing protein n=1 Tax=Hoeflea sp. YIM 152468 TaxID=3031759 RepID=UPI0023DA8124|nr:EAL domain-containing protein [Hoeflea sp. YIM 152468]MDF1606891.1 EAL domain-containing protein [Hoeflea sp. YIM 152468]
MRAEYSVTIGRQTMVHQSELRTQHSDTYERALEAAGLGVWDWNLSTGACKYSEQWCQMLGYQKKDLPKGADLWLLLVHPDDRERAIQSGDRHLAGETASIETELRLRHKNGHWVWVLDRGCIVERDENGRPVRVVGVQTDITRQKEAEQNLGQTNERFRLALAASGIGIWHYDIGLQKSNWDARTRAIFGLYPGPTDIIATTWQKFLHPDDRDWTEREHADALSKDEEVNLRYRIIREDGEIRHVETLAKTVPEDGLAGCLVGTIRDITDEVSAADALHAEKERYKVTLESISDAVISTDVRGRISFANPAALRMLALQDVDLTGQDLRTSFTQYLATSQDIPPQSSQDAGHIITTDTGTFRRKSSPLLSSAGELGGNVFIFQNITEEARRQQELAYAARHDALTGLYNRSAFDEALEDAIGAAADTPFAVLYIDLDHFKALNDYAGHAAGDEALRRIATGVCERLPSDAVFARLGGDEFAILLPGSDTTSARKTAEDTITAVRNVDLGFVVSRQPLGCSIGIALIDDPLISAPDVLARADDACYAAKSAGRNRSSVFVEQNDVLSSGLTAARMAAGLTEALEDNRVVLFGQEIRSIDRPHEWSGRIEILARLRSRDGRIVTPAQFISAAERFGVAPMLDRRIIGDALKQYGPTMEAMDLQLGFNLSAQTLSDPHLWSFIQQAVEETGAPYSHIGFEITETAAVTCFDTANLFVRQARRQGCVVSLDDFGSGLSSFDYLRRFPINCIKIDGAFIEKLIESKFDRAIVSSVVGIAKDLELDVVAEKIENAATVAHLQHLGVTFGQGYHLHKPEPLADMVARHLARVPTVPTPIRQIR